MPSNTKAYAREYRAKTKDAAKAYAREYRAKTKDAAKAYAREYRANHRASREEKDAFNAKARAKWVKTPNLSEEQKEKRRNKGRLSRSKQTPSGAEIQCECGCGTRLEQFDKRKRSRRFATGHNSVGNHHGKPKLAKGLFTCLKCGSNFEKGKRKEDAKSCIKFCSRKCRSQATGERLSGDPFYADRQRQLIKKLGNRPPLINKGASHWNWKGGITPVMAALRGTDEYKQWRIAVFRRDRFTCQQCAIIGKHLHAHHLKGFTDFPELRFVVSNGITLCKNCHLSLHGLISSVSC